MPLVTATIEIDCPEGYEPVAFRRADNGELWLAGDGEVRQDSHAPSTPRLILRPKWQPAPWMPKGAWLFWDADFAVAWMFTTHKPVEASGFYREHDDSSSCDAEIIARLFGETFTPPPTREPVQIQ